MVAFSPRAALCTFVVVAGFGFAVTAQLPGGLVGLVGMQRDGLLTIERGGAPPDEDERSEIVSAVLAHEARQTDRGALCVRLADEGEALAGERLAIARLQRAAGDAAPGARAPFVAELDRRRNPLRTWLRPSTVPGERFPLGEGEALQLRSAETALLGGPQAGPVDLILDMSGLPENLRSVASDCPVLAFTAPAVAGEIAFVETSFQRAGRPDEAWLYAVARTGGRWNVEAMARP